MRCAKFLFVAVCITFATSVTGSSQSLNGVGRDHGLVPNVVTLHELNHRIPSKAEREFDRAWKARKKGQYETAILAFQSAIAIDPEFCAARNDLATSYLLAGQFDLAIEQFHKALEVDPNISGLYSNLSLAYLKQHRYYEAEYAARQSLVTANGDPHGHYVLGMSLVAQSKFTPEAEDHLKRAEPAYPQANLWLAVGYMNRGKTDIARTHFVTYLATADKQSQVVASSIMQELEANLRKGL